MQILKRIFIGILLAALFALELWALSWVVCILLVKWPNGGVVSCITALGFLAMLVLYPVKPRLGKAVCSTAGIAALAGVVLNLAIIFIYLPRADYREVDNGKADVFADRRVMIVVPHQDDEINLAGGVIEEYIRYGSEVYVVYATNGDYGNAADTRLNEAINALDVLGVDEEHVIFLGYPDNATTPDGLSMYNTDAVVTSRAGHSATYALADHPPYREGRAYTAQNLCEDMQAVISEYRPDVLYAVGCDRHTDHTMVALLFDRAIGQLLKTEDYTPTIYKGYAYSTAFDAPKDAHTLNIRKTENPGEKLNLLAPGVFDWNTRIRMPVSPTSLSRIKESTPLYKSALEHESQNMYLVMDGVVNGDKVFWQRESTSLGYIADVTTSSGDVALLTDFVLADSANTRDLPGSVTGVWRADSADAEPSITFAFDKPQNIARIKLYDDPDPDSNILAARLTLDNGAEFTLGALAPLGSATEFAVGAENVRSFTLRITDFEGAAPGLTELEAYAEPYTPDADFIKLMNADGDFVYDYYLDPSGVERFGIYSHPQAADGVQYSVECIGDRCSAVMDGDELVVTCPVGKSCTVTVSDGRRTDTAFFRNSGSKEFPYPVRMCDVERELVGIVKLLFESEENFDMFTSHFIEARQWEFKQIATAVLWQIHQIKDSLFR